MIKSVHDFIGEKGAAVIATATRRKVGAVRVWKCRNYFPRDAWPELIGAFPDEITLEVLQKLERKHPPVRKAA